MATVIKVILSRRQCSPSTPAPNVSLIRLGPSAQIEERGVLFSIIHIPLQDTVVNRNTCHSPPSMIEGDSGHARFLYSLPVR